MGKGRQLRFHQRNSQSPFLHVPYPKLYIWERSLPDFLSMGMLLMNQHVTLAILWVWFFALLCIGRTVISVSLCLEDSAAVGAYSQGHGVVAQRYLRLP